MKKLIFLSSLVFALLFVFVACNEEQGVEKKYQNNSKSYHNFDYSFSLCNIYNPNNPYDSIGIKHNQALQEFMNEDLNIFLIENNGVIDIDSSINKIKDWFINYYQDNYNLDIKNILDPPFNLNYYDLAQNPDSVLSICLLNSTLSENCKNTIRNYFNSIYEDTIACEMINKTQIFEDSVYYSSLYPENEKQLLLQIFSVGKYSISFWWEYYNLDELNFLNHRKIKASKILAKSKYKSPAHKAAFEITVSDAAGAYTGFITGVTGGPVGMAVGAGVSAVASSAVAAFLNWLG